MDPDLRCQLTVPLERAVGRPALARAGERAAAAHLARVHGLHLVAANLRVSQDDLRGELDVVMRDARSGLLVVCEVKTRTGADDGGLEALGAAQRARIRRMTAALLADGVLRGRSVRFDVVTVRPRVDGVSGTLLHLAGAW